MRLEVSFTLGTFDDAGDAFSLATSYLKKPLTVIQAPISFPNGVWIGHYSDMQKTLTADGDHWFSLHSGERISDLHDITSVNGISYWSDKAFATELIAMEILDDSFLDLDAFIKAAAIRKFNFGMMYDSRKACWQREQFVSTFHKYGKSLEGRKLISHPYWTDKVGLTVDIRNNPGRHIQTHNMRLMAAPEMWFGPGAWGYFEESDVLDFDIALEKEYVAPGTIHIKLFDINEYDYEAFHILDLQWEFRQCTKMDEIEEKLNDQLPFSIVY
ncbi:hypothetical protein [Chitinophaga filiformis]|uniref:Uncharacterized protein n=1 Tax=Chitinophaga filiformis TaxID=104663 RepID=A0A1G7SK91_CHIFI|nr:hypothetical protein [Chitinophaga filiformis]SDG22839.1 hypothetical protein SAMN04488121_103887 [Chitinophaga filiformis]